MHVSEAIDKVLKLRIGQVSMPDDLAFVPYQPGLRENVLNG